VLPSIPETERLDIKAYHLMASRFNEIGRIAKEEGIRFAYHNHGYGLIPEDNGIVPLDIIFEETDSDKVFFEMDLFWTVAGKADPIDLLKKHKGRYKMLHIKDMKSITYFKGKGSTSSEWMELFPQLVPAGSGEIPLKDIMDVAYHSGVLHYFVEHDLAPNPYENIQSAYDFLKALRF
jgi:sugar phosphate isomerase/epimerase